MFSWLFPLATATLINPAIIFQTKHPELAIVAQSPGETGQHSQGISCQPPLLSRLQRHKIAPGETAATIAQKYNLLPETLIRLNPILQGGSVPVGSEILIPPMNGVRLEVPAGATWKDLENAYGVRADVLFELNGCQKTPKVVFIPGVNWTARDNARRNYTGLKHYPLPQNARIGLPYGWQKEATDGKMMFHSGVDFLAESGTPVLAADEGTVAFVGEEGPYGYLIVISHGEEWQTRYAHLDKVRVKIGQQVKAGEVIGTVGTTGKPDIKAPHLHFEIRYKSPAGWVAQDPKLHLPAGTRE
ncbi:metalloendopeptidase-like membrane protein [Pleurocapsa sp. PCC 7327]|uniref:M23 family metallopeptidase n=1 Tax=Pleurocapsa sp. PCC 7327 TaxID=118163 RepID=UPI00029FEAEA|nr:M23 family metallopeptidase [Pleurocapsa sp. PCC 7327]AFY77743.1 metalloendopeptidase-like membrane protein [Pleurocapsa sp. PCC 7327]